LQLFEVNTHHGSPMSSHLFDNQLFVMLTGLFFRSYSWLSRFPWWIIRAGLLQVGRFSCRPCISIKSLKAGQIQDLPKGADHGERGTRAYDGVLGSEPLAGVKGQSRWGSAVWSTL